MPQDPQFDVFLSHSSKDKAVVRELAERLRGDGLRVWFDEPGGKSPAKLEHGLANSRVLVLCMSKNAFGSGWAKLENQTFRFRDPLKKDRRFIPLRLDDAPIKGSLDQFLYIDWRPEVREGEYAKLLDACRSVTQRNQPVQAPDHLQSSVISLDHEGSVWSVARSPDDQYVLSGSADKTMRLWEVATGHCVRVFEGHTNEVHQLFMDDTAAAALVFNPQNENPFESLGH